MRVDFCGIRAAGIVALAAPCLAGAQAPAPSDTVRPPLTESAETITIVDGTDTEAGRALARTLARPHIVIDGRGRAVALPRGATFPSSVIVIAPRVTVGARIPGDVVIIGGDLFLHPGGRIDGDALAIGGGVYNSSLGTITGRLLSFRDETFDVTRGGGGGGGLVLSHRVTREEYAVSVISWPFKVGLRLPSYDRIDGAVLPWGPYVSLGRFTFDPTVTYRSDLGAFDPAARATFAGSAVALSLDARRGTFSNDKWIRGDLVNSLTTLWAGRDTRNYYRADRIELSLGYRWTIGNIVLEPRVGAVNELGWSSGAELSADSHPYSIFGKDSVDGIYRRNPAVARGRIESGIAGGEFAWSADDVSARLRATFERAWSAPLVGTLEGEFTQTTLHGTVSFPTFGAQRLESRAHFVTSTKGAHRPPPQRYAYLGGGGTIPTMDLLEQGGNELLFFESNYIIPVPLIQLPFVGSPVVTLRYMTGAAGIDDLPKLTQNVGVRVGVRFVGVEYLIDPSSKEKVFGIGLSLTP